MNPSAKSLGLNVVRSAGNEEHLLCPFHSDTKPSASWNRKKGLFNCYVCNLGLNLVQLSARLGVKFDFEEQDGAIAPMPEEYNLMTEKEIIPLGSDTYHPYIEKRGISRRVASQYNILWNFSTPQSAVMPIPNLKGEIIGAVHRYAEPKIAGTRYKIYGDTTPVWPLSFLVGKEQGAYMFVTEGAWSAMRMHTWWNNQGLQSETCLALLGAKANQEIVDTLRPFKPIFLYDGDTAGVNACRKMRKLMPLAHAWTLSKSPDDMDDAEMQVLFNKVYEGVTGDKL